jgi:hypothetical protein
MTQHKNDPLFRRIQRIEPSGFVTYGRVDSLGETRHHGDSSLNMELLSVSSQFGGARPSEVELYKKRHLSGLIRCQASQKVNFGSEKFA